MAMVAELREVFPYFPIPNYPWARMTANVLHTMQREREVYMEGATRVAGSEEDVEMASAGEDMVPAEPVEEIAVEPLSRGKCVSQARSQMDMTQHRSL